MTVAPSPVQLGNGAQCPEAFTCPNVETSTSPAEIVSAAAPLRKDTGSSLQAFFRTAIVETWKYDAVKAVIIGAVLVFIPPLMLVDMSVQYTRKMLSWTSSRDYLTERGRTVVDYFCELNVARILCWVCILGEVWFTMNVLFAKLTYIFLSWLNSYLVSVGFLPVCLLVFIVGFIMFMLPPVPGIPVYVFSGIVIAEQGKHVDYVDFVGSIVVACVLSFFTKLVACTGQYYIGYRMGESVKIQQLIGVDKVPTRAIEKVLSQRGLQPSKVCVLIGGPDWPVSVTCGILRVNIPQMLLGTLPVIFIASPCVVAGAFLTRINGGADDPWVARSALAILASTVAQGGALALAVILTGRVIAMHHVELAKDRPEHKIVEDLTRREQSYHYAYMCATAWKNMSWGARAIIILAAYGQKLSNFVMTIFPGECFRSFYLSSQIAGDYDAYPPGLEGNAWTIVRLPTGVLMLVVWCMAVLLHFWHCKNSTFRAKALRANSNSLSL